jgi:hypothetical protein
VLDALSNGGRKASGPGSKSGGISNVLNGVRVKQAVPSVLDISATAGPAALERPGVSATPLSETPVIREDSVVSAAESTSASTKPQQASKVVEPSPESDEATTPAVTSRTEEFPSFSVDADQAQAQATTLTSP